MRRSFYKNAVIVALLCFLATAYIIDFKSIFMSVEPVSYLIYGITFALIATCTLKKDSLLEYFRLLKVSKDDLKNIPEKTYNFSKVSNSRQLKNCNIEEYSGKNKVLYSFFSKFKEKYNRAEIETHLLTLRNQISISAKKAREIGNFLYVIIAVSTVSAFIYDSHMKGILAVSMFLTVGNLMVQKRIESNIEYLETVINLCMDISGDILDFKNARYVMYKTMDLLLLTEDDVVIKTIEPKKMIATSKKIGASNEIENRKSALMKLNNKKSSINTNQKRMVG